MSFDYITEGPPIQPVTISPALLLDKINNNLYISNGISTNWVIVGTSGGANDSVQNITTSTLVDFLGATNTFVKAVGGASGITLTLVTALGNAGQRITIIKTDASVGGVTIQADQIDIPEQTINGSINPYVLTNQYQAATFESDGANWLIVALAG